MDEKIKQILNECEAFIENSTAEELLAYEESLGINYNDYIVRENFNSFIVLDELEQIIGSYSCKCRVQESKSIIKNNLVVAA